MVETLKSHLAISDVLMRMDIREAQIKALYAKILDMKKEWQEAKREVRLLNMKLPPEVASERRRQKILASKRAWWLKMQAERKALRDAARRLKRKKKKKVRVPLKH